jgi:hypothetical protein
MTNKKLPWTQYLIRIWEFRSQSNRAGVPAFEAFFGGRFHRRPVKMQALRSYPIRWSAILALD